MSPSRATGRQQDFLQIGKAESFFSCFSVLASSEVGIQGAKIM